MAEDYLRVDPTAYARQREARIERAREIRAAREHTRNGDHGVLEELAYPEQVKPRRRHKEVAPGWTQHTCKKTGKLYYHHAASGKTTWIRPPEAGPPPAAVSRTEDAQREDDGRAATTGMFMRRSESDLSTRNQMTEAEFEAWLDALKGKTLTGSQARRLAMIVQQYDQPSGLSSLKLSMRNKRESSTNGEAQLRSRSASEKAPRQRRPEWNNNFATDEDRQETIAQETIAQDPTAGRTQRIDEDDDRYRTLFRPADNEDSTRRKRRSPQHVEKRLSVSDPLASGDPEDEDIGTLSDSCVHCGRLMTSQALDKMAKVHGVRCCPKCAPTRRRKQFNTAARRAQAIAGNPHDRQLVKKGIATVKRDLSENARDEQKPAKWKAQSEQLRQAMKSMRAAAAADKAGKPLPPMHHSEPDPTLVPCPHCGRRFNQQAADRHIPKCQDIKAKPKMLRRGAGTPGPVRR